MSNYGRGNFDVFPDSYADALITSDAHEQSQFLMSSLESKANAVAR